MKRGFYLGVASVVFIGLLMPDNEKNVATLLALMGKENTEANRIAVAGIMGASWPAIVSLLLYRKLNPVKPAEQEAFERLIKSVLN